MSPSGVATEPVESFTAGENTLATVAPDTVAPDTLAPVRPADAPEHVDTDHGDHDRFAHYCRKADITRALGDRRSDRGAVRQEVGSDPRPLALSDLSELRGAQSRRLDAVTATGSSWPHVRSSTRTPRRVGSTSSRSSAARER